MQLSLLCNSELISELMITEGNKQKKAEPSNPAFIIEHRMGLSVNFP
jgi:hypothetical protein